MDLYHNGLPLLLNLFLLNTTKISEDIFIFQLQYGVNLISRKNIADFEIFEILKF